MIDLKQAIAVLEECDELIDRLDGLELDERKSTPVADLKLLREQRIEASQRLLVLTSNLRLAASLVETEYWFSRGHKDPLNPGRTL